MVAVGEMVAGVLEDAAGLGTPGVALAALVGVAVVGGVPRARPLAKGAIKGYLTVKDRASEGFFTARERASEGVLTARERAGGAGFIAREGATAWLAEIREKLQDTYAEAKHEYSLERAAANGAEEADAVEPVVAAAEHHPEAPLATREPLSAKHPVEHDATPIAATADAAEAHDGSPPVATAASTAETHDQQPPVAATAPTPKARDGSRAVSAASRTASARKAAPAPKPIRRPSQQRAATTDDAKPEA